MQGASTGWWVAVVGLVLVTPNAGLLRHGAEQHAEEDSYGTLLAAPELKLLFCFIPKNACTQFNKLMNALNNIPVFGDICGPSDPNFRSLASREVIRNHVDDPSWTKAVFLRDPLERLVSAYKSKCEPPAECGGCLDQDFNKLVQKLGPNMTNVHYMPQSTFCGGLSDKIGSYDFVGHVSHNSTAMNEQVQEMLSLVQRRNPHARLPGYALMSTRSGHPIPTQDADPDGSLLEAVPALGEIDEAAPSGREFAEAFFPALERDPDHLKHNTGSWGTSLLRYYQPKERPSALAKVLDYYAEDYAKLPGLSVPAWAQTSPPAPSSTSARRSWNPFKRHH